MSGSGGAPEPVAPVEAALDRVRRVRRRSTRTRMLRALCHGVATGTLLAAAAGGTGALFGAPPGAWLLFAAAPGLAVAFHGVLHARRALRAAALELDRAAGTKERFLSVLSATDPEVREVTARQALGIARGKEVRGGPSGAAPAAALGVALLAGVLVLAPGALREEPGARDGGSPGPALAARGAPGSGAGSGEAANPSATARDPAAEFVARAARGEGLSEADWDAIERLGTTDAQRDAVRRALGEGDAASAARLLADAVDRARRDAAAGAARAGATAWAAYEAALARPVWGPRFDRVVREYFEAAPR